MKNKSIKLNVVLNFIKNLLILVFPLITFPYVSRILQAENIGRVQFATSIVSYFALLASLGISVYAIREGSSLKSDSKKLSEFCNQIFSLNLFTTIIAYVFLLITLFVSNFDSTAITLISIYSITIVFTTIGVDWINSIFEDFLYITLRTIVIQIITLIFTFLLIRSSTDYYLYTIILVISGVGTNILNWFYVKKYINLKITFRINFLKHIKPILILFSASLATTIYNSSDITMLGIIKNEYVVGIYYVGSKIYSIIKQLLNSFVAVTIPRISHYYANNMEDEKCDLLNRIFKLIIIIVLPAITGLAILSKEIVLLLFGDGYTLSSTSLLILSFALIFAIIANFSSNLILVTHKEELKSLISTIIAAIANFLLNLILIPLFSSNGAALTTVIAEVIAATISTIFAIKYFKPTNFMKPLLGSLLGCIIIVVYSTLIKYIGLNILFTILFVVFGSILLYAFCVYIFNKDLIKELRRKKVSN